MKKTKKYLYTTVAAIGLMMSTAGCGDYLNINTSPTQLKTASTAQALTAAIGALAFYQGTDLYLYGSIFSQQGTGNGVSGSQTRIYDQYTVTNTDVNNIYSNYYAGALTDLDYVKKQALKEGNPQYAGIARILSAYTYQNIVDAWGDSPFKDALKGVANVQPKFDASKEIYDSLFVMVDTGIANLKQTNVRTVSTEDLIYGGNMVRWEKFANTLKLRMALHYAKDDGGTKLKALITAAPIFIASNADNFQMVWETTTNRQNPLHQFEISRQDYWAPSLVLVNMMNTKVDPRRATYLTPYPAPATIANGAGTLGAAYVGTASNSTTTTPSSRIHTYIRGPVTADTGARTTGGAPTASAVTYDGTAPTKMLTFAEYNFIMAEAVRVYGAGANTLVAANTFYRAGINASMTDAGVAAVDVTTYLAQVNSTLTGGAGDLQLIIEEKFIANFGVCMEPWTDWRRTNFPTITTSVAAASVGNSVIPRILVYPLAEQQTNIANVPNRASMALKGVFWDK